LWIRFSTQAASRNTLVDKGCALPDWHDSFLLFLLLVDERWEDLRVEGDQVAKEERGRTVSDSQVGIGYRAEYRYWSALILQTRQDLLRPSESESLLMYRSTGSSDVDESIILMISAPQRRRVVMDLLPEMLDDRIQYE